MQRLQSVATTAIRTASRRTAAVPIVVAPRCRSLVLTCSSAFLTSPVRHSSTATASPASVPAFQLWPSGENVVTWLVRENSEQGKYQQVATARQHTITLDEPDRYPGGTDAGPSPCDLLTSALGGCKSMTLRMYADRKRIRLAPVAIQVMHNKVPAAEVEEAQAAKLTGIINLWEVELTLRAPEGEEPLSTQTADAMLAVANKCPVHMTLAGNPQNIIRSKLV